MSREIPWKLHDAQVSHALRQILSTKPNWVRHHEGVDHDVAVIGGGQTGLAVVHALHLLGITNVVMIDANPDGLAGIWRTTARMPTLRTAKTIAGPEGSNTLLGFRIWYESRYGHEAFDAIDKIPRLDWADYLDWFQRITGIASVSGTRLDLIEPTGQRLRLRLCKDDQPHYLTVRRLVLATGFLGSGGGHIPAIIKTGLSPERYSHSSDQIPPNTMKGKRIAVLGAAASAFDAASFALENGARNVDLLVRRPHLRDERPAHGGVPFLGISASFHSLPDAIRWKLVSQQKQAAIRPTGTSVARLSDVENFSIHYNADLQQVAEGPASIRLCAGGVCREYDHVICGTGYEVDLKRRPELALLYRDILLWRDRKATAPQEAEDPLGQHPYLGRHYEYQGNISDVAPWLAHIYAFNLSAQLSFGRFLGDIGSLPEAVPRLVRGIEQSLFAEDRNFYLMRMQRHLEQRLSL